MEKKEIKLKTIKANKLTIYISFHKFCCVWAAQ